MSRPSGREFLMCLLAGVIAALIMIPLTFYAIDREMAIIEAAVKAAAAPDTVIKYYGVESVEAANGKVVVKFQPVKEVKP